MVRVLMKKRNNLQPQRLHTIKIMRVIAAVMKVTGNISMLLRRVMTFTKKTIMTTVEHVDLLDTVQVRRRLLVRIQAATHQVLSPVEVQRQVQVPPELELVGARRQVLLLLEQLEAVGARRQVLLKDVAAEALGQERISVVARRVRRLPDPR
jgi:hypothetical protein